MYSKGGYKIISLPKDPHEKKEDTLTLSFFLAQSALSLVLLATSSAVTSRSLFLLQSNECGILF